MKKYFVFFSILLLSSVALFAQVQEPKQSQIQELSDTIWTHQVSGYTKAIKFSPDGKYIYAASESNIIVKIDVATNKEIYGIKTLGEFKSMDLSKDGKYLLLTASKDTVLLINAEDKTLIRQFIIPASTELKGLPLSASISYDNKYCSITYYRTFPNFKYKISILVWELETGKLIKDSDASYSGANFIKFSPTENIFAVGNYKGDNGKATIDIYSTDTWEIIYTFDGHSEDIDGLNFSKDGNYLASWSGTDQNLIKIWDIKNRKLKQDINALNYLINNAWDVCFLNNNSVVASCRNLVNSKLRFEFTLVNLDKQTKSTINIFSEDYSSAYLDINTFQNKNLLATSTYAKRLVSLFNLDKTLDVSPESSNTSPILYPNPVTKELNISLVNINNTLVNYRIINNTGQEVLHNSSIIQNNMIKINTSNLSRGAYILNLQYNNTSKSFNFIIQ